MPIWSPLFFISFVFLSKRPSLFVCSHFRSSTQVSSSQISRFFTHSKANDETHPKTENPNTQNQSASSESSDCSSTVTATNRDTNDNQPLYAVDDKQDEKRSHGSKRKHERKCDKKTDSKSTIKSFFANELNDSLADFEAPNKVAKKVPTKVLPTKAAKSSRSRRKQQPDIRKALNKEDAASGNDYSHLPEDAQLELALAISKAESVNGIADGASSSSSSSSKTVDLNGFAFQPSNSKSNSDVDVLNFFNMNRKTKSRFKWNTKCTQLTRRNDDTQKSKVRDKIDEILLNNIIVESSQADRLKSSERIDIAGYSPHCIHSRRLQRICISERILFEMNNCDRNTNSGLCSYYTNNLVEASEAGAETLLKDWSKIPGRDSIYDGVHGTTSEVNETDEHEAVTASSPEYDIQTESSLSEADGGKIDEQIEHAFTVTDDQQMDTAGCSNVYQSSAAMDGKSDSAVHDVEDNDRTLIMNFEDIQSKINTINSNIRLSQQFCDMDTDFTCQAATTLRAPSPDLFDDDDDDDVVFCADNDIAVSDGNRKFSQLIPYNKTIDDLPFPFILEETCDTRSPDLPTCDDDDDDATRCSAIEVASEDVIMISSSEGNTNECNTDPGKSLPILFIFSQINCDIKFSSLE